MKHECNTLLTILFTKYIFTTIFNIKFKYISYLKAWTNMRYMI